MRSRRRCQVRHEIELIRNIQRVCSLELQANAQLKMATVVAKIMGQSPVKLNSTTVASLVRFVTALGGHA